MEWLRRVWYFMNRRKLERELQDEMDAHRAMMREPKAFGNTLRLREESRDIWGWNWLDDLRRDFSYSLRSLRRTPVFMLASIVMLGVGIGLNLTVFELGNAFFLSPLPLKDLDSLVRFDRKSPQYQTNKVPYPAIRFIAAHGSVLSDVMSREKTTMVWADDTRTPGAFVSSNWFSGLGLDPIHGRVLSEGIDDLSGAAPAAVISEWFWKEKLGGNPGIVGSTTQINGRNATVVGIVRANIDEISPSAPRVWLPIEQLPYFMPGSDLQTRWDTGPEMYARLRPGVSPNIAREALRPVMTDLASQHPEAIRNTEWLEPFTGRTRFRDPVLARGDQMQVLFLSLLTGITLLVACANLGNLILSRNIGRFHEMGIRVALGASRATVMRHLLTESVLLTGFGCAGGLVLCTIALRAFTASVDLPFFSTLSLDWRTAVATLSVGLFTTASVGLMPAWRLSRKASGTSLKGSPYLSAHGLSQSRLRNVLVGLQVMCSFVLLVIGVLVVREMQRAASAPRLAFENVAAMEVALDQFGIRKDAAREYWRTVTRVLSTSPEVDRVSIVESVPFGQTSEQGSFKKDAPGLPVVSNRVDSNFFGLFGVSFLAGRTFDDSDDSQTSVIISRRLAEKMYGVVDVVGKPFPKTRPTATIVGVVADAQTMSPRDTSGAQRYSPLRPDDFGHYRLVVRAKRDPRVLLPVLKTAAQSADSNLVPGIHLIRSDYEQASRAGRTLDLMFVGMAFIALSIASFGVFGVVSYAVTSRQKEIGIRLAVGANRRAIVVLVLSDLIRFVVPAILLGAGASLLARTLLNNILLIGTLDPLVVSGVVVLMLATTGLAALFPTLRAVRADAINVLKPDC